jgi:hypothetical protein
MQRNAKKAKYSSWKGKAGMCSAPQLYLAYTVYMRRNRRCTGLITGAYADNSSKKYQINTLLISNSTLDWCEYKLLESSIWNRRYQSSIPRG